VNDWWFGEGTLSNVISWKKARKGLRKWGKKMKNLSPKMILFRLKKTSLGGESSIRNEQVEGNVGVLGRKGRASLRRETRPQRANSPEDLVIENLGITEKEEGKGVKTKKILRRALKGNLSECAKIEECEVRGERGDVL